MDLAGAVCLRPLSVALDDCDSTSGCFIFKYYYCLMDGPKGGQVSFKFLIKELLRTPQIGSYLHKSVATKPLTIARSHDKMSRFQ